LFNLFTGKF